MITSDLLIGALLGGSAVAIMAALAGALVRQTLAKRAATRAAGAAQRAAQAAEQRAETALKKAEAAQRQADANGQWYEAVVGEFGRLVDRLRAVADIEAGYPGVENPGPLHAFLTDTPVPGYCHDAENLVRDRAAAIRSDVSAAARAGVRGVADTAQSYLTRLQIKIDEELGIHTDIGPFHQGLIEIDHLATQALHSLQRLRILAGSWPGVQRDDCTFREIVESARGRIGPYLRVDYNYEPETGETWVEGRVVEPIIVALAEVLDNATSYSDDRVDVYVQEVQAGYRVVVEDRGLGMNSFQRAEAEYLLSRHATLEAAGLKDERKLGFAIVGRLACDYGFRVDVDAPSSSNGVKAVCLVPAHLTGRSPRPEPRQAAPPPREEPEPAEPPSITTAAGLPKRQAHARPAPTARSPITGAVPAEGEDAGMESLFEALRAGYADRDTEQGQS
ncbi:hypothetical protein SAMN05444920_102789 [Nonomuraea solani]|uniref:histidine kinase n=1 Tax=Nonomuraea solani TaxID=1144553 RepID=A0A1H5ZN58_9ACTN|nr:sensor histidine kinase [Nonomuraea solani]SEG37948.1 hypothetical protein SAMN05444920_102789 [Nonomuraea solani]